MIENAEYELRQNNIYQYLKSIQHRETREIFYIQNFIPYSDLKFWNNSPEGEMQNIAKSKGEVMGKSAERIKIGLIRHPINNGKYIHGAVQDIKVIWDQVFCVSSKSLCSHVGNDTSDS